MIYLLGMRIKVEVPDSVKATGSAVYIANHQSALDVLALAGVLRPRTVSIGKQSLAYIPIFGLLFWITGNILINRSDSKSAASTIKRVVSQIKRKQMSVWMFPEGTRSKGRGLLPFKSGAFRVAQKAKVPLVPVAVSSMADFRLNRWSNGTLLVKFMEPISVEDKDIRSLMSDTHALMAAELQRINSGQQTVAQAST
jgi:1-acyl-sn-glycerol-3-phosphate acyltransferase